MRCISIDWRNSATITACVSKYDQLTSYKNAGEISDDAAAAARELVRQLQLNNPGMDVNIARRLLLGAVDSEFDNATADALMEKVGDWEIAPYNEGSIPELRKVA